MITFYDSRGFKYVFSYGRGLFQDGNITVCEDLSSFTVEKRLLEEQLKIAVTLRFRNFPELVLEYPLGQYENLEMDLDKIHKEVYKIPSSTVSFRRWLGRVFLKRVIL